MSRSEFVCCAGTCGFFGVAENAVLLEAGGAMEVNKLRNLAMRACAASIAIRDEAGALSIATPHDCGANPVEPAALETLKAEIAEAVI